VNVKCQQKWRKKRRQHKRQIQLCGLSLTKLLMNFNTGHIVSRFQFTYKKHPHWQFDFDCTSLSQTASDFQRVWSPNKMHTVFTPNSNMLAQFLILIILIIHCTKIYEFFKIYVPLSIAIVCMISLKMLLLIQRKKQLWRQIVRKILWTKYNNTFLAVILKPIIT